MDDSQREPFWTWADLLLFLVLGAPLFVAVFWILNMAIGPFTSNRALSLMIPQFVGQIAMLGPMALLFRWKYERPFLSAIRWGVRVAEVGVSYVGGIALGLGVLLIAAALRTPKIESPMEDLMKEPGAAVWVAIFAVSIGPALEEIFFRGLFQPLATRTFGLIGGILLASVPFALLHGPQYAWSWQHIVVIVIAGSGFGWWRARTGSTGASALMHAGYNSVLVVLYLLGRTVV